jgi:hypothetical protein
MVTAFITGQKVHQKGSTVTQDSQMALATLYQLLVLSSLLVSTRFVLMHSATVLDTDQLMPHIVFSQDMWPSLLSSAAPLPHHPTPQNETYRINMFSGLEPG